MEPSRLACAALYCLLRIGFQFLNHKEDKQINSSSVTPKVFSKAALGAYLSQHQRCEQSLPFWSWGEDRSYPESIPKGIKESKSFQNFAMFRRCDGPGIWQIASRC